MRKILPVFFSFFIALVFFLIPSLSLAQSTEDFVNETESSAGSTEPGQGITFEESQRNQKSMPVDIYPVPSDRNLPFAGQNHSYSVVLRGNGEAVITMKAALSNTNPDGSNLNKVSFRIPSRVIPSDISVYQIIVQGYCARYEERNYNYNPDSRYYQPSCVEYSDPDYFNYYGGGKYLRAEYEYSGDTLTVNLPRPIAENKSGAFFIYFRAMGYARKNILGAYKFNFESIKSFEPINQLNVGISTDADLFLKGGRGQVEYRFADTAVMLKESAGGVSLPQSSSAIDRVVGQIGQGTIVKNASNLAPLESYKVSGMYADSRIKLYGKEMTVVLAVILIAAAMILFFVRRFFGAITTPAPVTVKKAVVNTQSSDNVKLFMTSLGISFLSSLVLAGYTLLVMFVSQNLNYIDYQMASMLRLAGIVFSFCIYSVVLFVPGIYYGVKKGMGWGILTVILTVGWLFIYFAITVLVVFFFGNQQQPYPVMQMMEGGFKR